MRTLKVINPSDLSEISKLNFTSKNEAFEVVNKAYQLHKNYPTGLAKGERIAVLESFYRLMSQNKEAIIDLSVQEGGKPYRDSVTEMDRALDGIQLAIQSVKNLNGQMVPMDLNQASAGKVAYTQLLPIGVVFSISAFNHPINLAIHQILPAVAAGCPVIYKPALTTPMVSQKIINYLYKAGLPEEWCTYLLCDNNVTEAVAQSDLLGFVSFIGSSKVGWQLKSKLAPGVKIALEHGGNAPVVVAKDADLNLAAQQLVKAGFYHAGQVCVSAQRIYVQAEVFDQFLSLFKSAAVDLIVGDAMKKESDVGPIITEEALNRIDHWVKLAVKEGAELVQGGTIVNKTYYQPTILVNPSSESLVTQEEIFGPVVCIYKVKTEEEAIEKANESPYIFQTAAYTSSLSGAFRFSEQLNGATVLINVHPAFRVDWMPFGGQGLSGEGVGGIEYSVQDMLKQKLVIIQK